jgi:hypothetical protein
METLTTMAMEGSAAVTPDSSAGAVLHFAAGQSETNGSGNSVDGAGVETTFGGRPPRFDQHWAISGTHRSWLGFSPASGLPK